MPSVSRDTAEQRITDGPVESFSADLDETVHAGEAFYLPPGHIPVGNRPNSRIVQFSPTNKLRDVEAVLRRTSKPYNSHNHLLMSV